MPGNKNTNNNLDMFIAIKLLIPMKSMKSRKKKTGHFHNHFRRCHPGLPAKISLGFLIFEWFCFAMRPGFYASLPGFGMLKNRKCV